MDKHIALTGVLRWDKKGVSVLGHIKPLANTPLFAFPLHSLNYRLFKRTASTAMFAFILSPLMSMLTLGLFSLTSVVGFLDSIAAAKQNSIRFGYSISPNRELVALGIHVIILAVYIFLCFMGGVGNLTGSFIPGTLPAYGSITR